MGKLLEVKNLEVELVNRGMILKDVSFDISKGERVVLLGQSGCGKSMTAMSIVNLLPAGVHKVKGEVLLNGAVFEDDMRGKGIGVIMQNPASCFDQIFTIKTQFLDTYSSNGKSKPTDAELCSLIESVGLADSMQLLSSYPFQLSGGMLQRLMIALTIAMEPDLIIADEATTDLDLMGQKEILNLLVSLTAKKGVGLLFITHDIGVAFKIADRVIVMDKGKIVDSCNVDEVNLSKSVYTQRLVCAYKGFYASAWGDM